jgi:hypothetical protein
MPDVLAAAASHRLGRAISPAARVGGLGPPPTGRDDGPRRTAATASRSTAARRADVGENHSERDSADAEQHAVRAGRQRPVAHPAAQQTEVPKDAAEHESKRMKGRG